MEQTATLGFLLPVMAAYGAAAALMLGLAMRNPPWWPLAPEPQRPQRAWIDAALIVLVAAGVLGVGQIYRQGWLLPSYEDWLGSITWTVNNLIIYAPLFIALAVRRQGPGTMYLDHRGVGIKALAGVILGVVSVTVFHAARGETGLIPQSLAASVKLENLENFVPVFLENAAIAFIFVRLRWTLGLWPALLIPALLFAASHIPRMIENERTILEMAGFMAANTAIAAGVLAVIHRSRDIIWLGMVHYLMDVAINAFETAPTPAVVA